jgi:hypothetical protein
MESKKINQLATNVNPQTSDLTTIGDPITGQLKKITWLQVAHLIGAQASVTLQQVTDNGNTTTDPITTGGLTLTNIGTGVVRSTNGEVVGTYGYGLANGVATLDSGGKIPAAQLPSSVMEYKGTWNASTNTPTLADGTGDNGDVYLVNVAGSQDLGSGTISFAVGDWVVYNGTIWQKSLNSNAVASVFGRTGTITAQEGDYNIDQLGDVAITSAAANDYLRYTGSSWVNTPFPALLSSDKLVLAVRNNSGATINKGTVVYINGATAGYPTIAKALATGDSTSAQTMGVVQDNISNNANGYVVAFGQITGIDTSAYTAGTQLYLSSTTAGAFTSTKQYAPNHLVYVGVVTTQNAVNGVIEVRVQNGYELDEIHDVSAQNPSNNDGIFFNSTTSLWEKKSIATVLGYTPEQPLTFSAPLSRSTNTISIPVATSSANGYLSSTDWTTFNNKLTSPMTTLGDIIYGGSSGAATRLAGNTTTTKQYLSQTGTGTVSAAPAWATIAGSDITGAALTKTDDTNVTLTLGGTPTTALLRAASLTLGWTGQLSVSRGGTGAASFTSGEILYGAGTSAITTSSTFTFSPTGKFLVNNSAAAGGIGIDFTPTINANANNDIIYGLRVNPTFNNGAYTGVTQRALGVFGNVYINGTITGAAWGGSVIGSSYGGAGTISGILKANGSGTVSAAVAGTDYVVPSALNSYLPLTGGTLTGSLSGTTASFSTSTNSTNPVITARNTSNGTAANSSIAVANDVTTNGGGIALFSSLFTSTGQYRAAGTYVYSNQGGGLTLHAEGANSMYLATNGTTALTINSSQGAVFSKSVTANRFYGDYSTVLNTYTTANPSTNVLLMSSPNDRDCWIFLDQADAGSNWGIYHRNIDTAVSGLPGNAIGFVGGGTSALQAYIDLTNGNTFFKGTLSVTGAASFSPATAGYAMTITNIEDSSQGLLLRSTDADTTLYIARFQSSASAVSTTWVDRFSIAKNGSTVIGDNAPFVNVRLFVKGSDQTASNYALDIADSLNQDIAWFRNDKFIKFFGNFEVAATNSIITQRGGTGYSVLRLYGGDGTNTDVVEFQIRNRVDGGNFSTIGNFSDHDLHLRTNNVNRLTIAATTGAVTFNSTTARQFLINTTAIGGYIGILRNGSDEFYIGKSNVIAGGSGFYDIYANANGGGLRLYTNGNGSAALTLATTNVATFNSSVLANAPSEGATGEGLIAGRSFKIDATGTGQRAVSYMVSNTLSDTYGSGLQAQYSNLAGDKAFGFNLNTSGNFELYSKNSGGSFINRFSIRQDGNTGLGIANPTQRFYIVGGKTVIDSTDASFGQFQIGNSGSGAEASMAFISGVTAFGTAPTSTNGFNYVWAIGANVYGIGGNQWGIANSGAGNYVAKIAYNSTSWTFSSDIRLKNIINPISNVLNKVCELNPIFYSWKNDESNQIKMGLIAQDVYKLFPEIVDVPKTEFNEKGNINYWGLNYGDMTPLLIQAIKELKAELDILKNSK